MKAKFEIFKNGIFSSHESYKKAALFVTRIGPDILISLTQGIADGGHAIVVWYWAKNAPTAKDRLKALRQKT